MSRQESHQFRCSLSEKTLYIGLSGHVDNKRIIAKSTISTWNSSLTFKIKLAVTCQFLLDNLYCNMIPLHSSLLYTWKKGIWNLVTFSFLQVVQFFLFWKKHIAALIKFKIYRKLKKIRCNILHGVFLSVILCI